MVWCKWQVTTRTQTNASYVVQVTGMEDATDGSCLAMEQAQTRSSLFGTSLAELKRNGKEINGMRVVARPFAHLTSRKEQELHMTPEQVQYKVQTLENLAAAAFDKAQVQKGYWEPGLITKMGGACEHSQVRRALLRRLSSSEKGSDTQRRRYMVRKFMAACARMMNKDEDVQADLVAVALNDRASEFVRTRSLYPLVRLNCPSHSTVQGIMKLASVSGAAAETRFREASTLVLGALINHADADKCAGGQAAKAHELLNRQLREALSQHHLTRANTILLAMKNSASGKHLPALVHAIDKHRRAMMTMSLKKNAIAVLNRLSVDSHDESLRAILLARLTAPPGRSSGKSNFTDHSQVLLEAKTSRLAEEEEEEEEEEDSCPTDDQYEKPIVCLGKSVPESGMFQFNLGAQAGMGVAKDAENIEKKLVEDGCTNYLFFEAVGSISIDVNGPFEGVAGMDPFALDVLTFTGQMKFKKRSKKRRGREPRSPRNRARTPTQKCSPERLVC